VKGPATTGIVKRLYGPYMAGMGAKGKNSITPWSPSTVRRQADRIKELGTGGQGRKRPQGRPDDLVRDISWSARRVTSKERVAACAVRVAPSSMVVTWPPPAVSGQAEQKQAARNSAEAWRIARHRCGEPSVDWSSGHQD